MNPLHVIRIHPTLVNLNKTSKTLLIVVKKTNVHFLLKLLTKIVKRKQPITRPSPFEVPNIPNCLSFMFKSALISFEEDERIPALLFIAISTLMRTKKRTIRYPLDKVIGLFSVKEFDVLSAYKE